MKKKIGIVALTIGFMLVGIGSYEGFEIYDNYLKSSNINSLYTGVYKSLDNDIEIVSASKEKMLVAIDNIKYEFSLNGEFFENNNLNYKIKMLNQSLSLFIDGEEEIFYKEK